jgi:hypothetical protein
MEITYAYMCSNYKSTLECFQEEEYAVSDEADSECYVQLTEYQGAERVPIYLLLS